MIRNARISVAAVAAGLLIVSAGAASAQPQRPAGQQPPDIAALLHLRPDQMNAYKAWQTAGQPRPEEVGLARAASNQALAAVPTPVRLQRIEAVLNAQLQVFRRRADATRAFYGQLSPDQQKLYDQITAAPAGGRGGSPGG